MNLQEIKNAVLSDKKVHWMNTLYQVVHKNDTWSIVYLPNNHCIGLTHKDNITLNGQEKDFFCNEPANNMKIPSLCIEPPNTEAKIDFLGNHGFTVTIKTEKDRHGKPTVYVQVVADDDRNTILGEILQEIPKSDTKR